MFRILAVLCLLALPALAADPGLYPGATVDPALGRKAQQEAAAQGLPQTGAKVEIATTTDSFEKVLAFYQKAGKEFRLGVRPGKPDPGYERELPGSTVPGGPPSGLKVKQSVIILDGADSMATSKDWLSVMRPFIFSSHVENGKFVFSDVRDITVIVRTRQP